MKPTYNEGTDSSYSGFGQESPSSFLLCGIDGGGTITTIVVCDECGRIRCSFQAPTLNHYAIGLEKTRQHYQYIQEKLKASLGCLPDYIYVGSSALDRPAGEELTRSLVGGIFDPLRCFIHSDLYIALLGHTLGEAGALLVAGTGSMACAVDKEDSYFTIGGWGHLLGDEGSGYHLGLAGIQAALQAADGLSPQTTLTASLVAFYRLGQLSDMIELAYNPPIEKSRIAAFAVEVEKAALNGDYVAEGLVEREIDWLCRLSRAILLKSGSHILGLYGGMLVKSPTIGREVIRRLEAEGFHAAYPRFKPEIGALIGAFSELGLPLDDSIIHHLSLYK